MTTEETRRYSSVSFQKGKIGLGIYSVTQTIQRCRYFILSPAYSLPPHSQAGEVACAGSNE